MKPNPIHEIERIMRLRKLTQADLDKLGFSAGSFSRIRRGIVSPSWKTIEKIANILGYQAFVSFRKL